MTMEERRLEFCARVAHEANRHWCWMHGDFTQQPWDGAEPWQRESAIRGVTVALQGATPEQQHAAWCKDKEAAGWVYGEIKDAVYKTHPCLVPYDQLPPEQKAKDALFIAIVKAVVGVPL